MSLSSKELFFIPLIIVLSLNTFFVTPEFFSKRKINVLLTNIRNFQAYKTIWKKNDVFKGEKKEFLVGKTIILPTGFCEKTFDKEGVICVGKENIFM